MGYYMEDESTSLDQLRKRLENTDLIPSHRALLDGVEAQMTSLGKAGVTSLADLRVRLKSAKGLASLSRESGVSSGYLTLLRRVVKGFFPKPQPLSGFDWLEPRTVHHLERVGVKNTRQLYEAATYGLAPSATKMGLCAQDLSEGIALADLSRIQWVSPTFARVLLAAGFTSPSEVAKADPDALCSAVAQTNETAHFYKGKVGLRDIRRLVASAAHVP